MGSDDIQLYAVDQYGQLCWTEWTDAAGWDFLTKGWLPIGISGDPTAVSRAAGILDVFFTASDNTIQHRWWDNGAGTSSNWESLDPAFSSSSSPCGNSNRSTQLLVFANDGTNLDSKMWIDIIFEAEVQSKKDAFIKGVVTICDYLAIRPDWLMAVIHIETGQTFDTHIQNPFTQATGLIQFMPNTAVGLGTTIQQLLTMSNVDQLTFVRKYYESMKGHFGSFLDLYFFTFYPAAIGKSDNFVLGSENVDPVKAAKAISAIATQNPSYDLNKDGQVTVGEIKQAMTGLFPPGISSLLLP